MGQLNYCDVCKNHVGGRMRDVGGKKMCDTCFMQNLQGGIAAPFVHKHPTPKRSERCDMCDEPGHDLREIEIDGEINVVCPECYAEFGGEPEFSDEPEFDGEPEPEFLDAEIVEDEPIVQNLHDCEETALVTKEQGIMAVLDDHKQAILQLEGTIKENVLKIGRHLCAARDELRHNGMGGFEGWVEEMLGWSKKTAYNYMAVYERFGDRVNFTRLALPQSAWYALAAESTPEDVRQDVITRAEAGEQMTFRQVEEMIKNYRTAAPTKIGASRSRMSSSSSGASARPASAPTPNTYCLFCSREDLPIYVTGPGQKSGICRECASLAVAQLPDINNEDE